MMRVSEEAGHCLSVANRVIVGITVLPVGLELTTSPMEISYETISRLQRVLGSFALGLFCREGTSTHSLGHGSRTGR